MRYVRTLERSLSSSEAPTEALRNPFDFRLLHQQLEVLERERDALEEQLFGLDAAADATREKEPAAPTPRPPKRSTTAPSVSRGSITAASDGTKRLGVQVSRRSLR